MEAHLFFFSQLLKSKPGNSWLSDLWSLARQCNVPPTQYGALAETRRRGGVENVSTAEVLAALTNSPGVLEGVVYGVQVPGSDGRAGTSGLCHSRMHCSRSRLYRQLGGHRRGSRGGLNRLGTSPPTRFVRKLGRMSIAVRVIIPPIKE